MTTTLLNTFKKTEKSSPRLYNNYCLLSSLTSSICLTLCRKGHVTSTPIHVHRRSTSVHLHLSYIVTLTLFGTVKARSQGLVDRLQIVQKIQRGRCYKAQARADGVDDGDGDG